MARIKKFTWDVETAGLDSKKDSILQFAAIIEINDIEVERLNWFIEPEDWSKCAPEALAINGMDKHFEENPGKFITQAQFYKDLIKVLSKYINKFDAQDKFYMIGYNSHAFDAQFLRTVFLANGDNFFGSYFWNPNVDVMLLAMAACIGQRHNLPNFKLGTVAKSLGIVIDEDRLHDGLYDVEVTRDMFNILDKELGLT
jgi:DNA polymerase-3 subunit epsilon